MLDTMCLYQNQTWCPSACRRNYLSATRQSLQCACTSKLLRPLRTSWMTKHPPIPFHWVDGTDRKAWKACWLIWAYLPNNPLTIQGPCGHHQPAQSGFPECTCQGLQSSGLPSVARSQVRRVAWLGSAQRSSRRWILGMFRGCIYMLFMHACIED